LTRCTNRLKNKFQIQKLKPFLEILTRYKLRYICTRLVTVHFFSYLTKFMVSPEKTLLLDDSHVLIKVVYYDWKYFTNYLYQGISKHFDLLWTLLHSWENTLVRTQSYFRKSQTLSWTSKFVELTSSPEQVLLIDGRWRNLGKGVWELYIKVYLPIQFHADIFCSHWDMFHTNFKYEKIQRAITLNLGSGGLWFLRSTLSLIKVYLPIKFHADILCSDWDMFHTKFMYEK